jgi:hypothetical protein
MNQTPFAFMASGVTEFDPTLGGTITPYFWYDFTDTSTMTIVGNEIREIDSKGSNVGSLAKGTSVSATKYITNYIPVTLQTDDGNYALFSGSISGTTYRNSTLARRYGTGDSRLDGSFGDDNPATMISFTKPNWNSIDAWLQAMSFKGYDVNASVKQPEEWSPLAYSVGTSNYPGTRYQATGSYSSTGERIIIQQLAGSNYSVEFGYNGSGDITNGILDYYHSGVSVLTPSGGTYATAEEGRGPGEYQGPYVPGPRSGTNASHEGFAIGSRSRTNAYAGPTFLCRHVLLYDSALSDSQITDVLNSYKAAYPQDNLNGS